MPPPLSPSITLSRHAAFFTPRLRADAMPPRFFFFVYFDAFACFRPPFFFASLMS